MKISRIKISNILGVEHLDFEPGQFTQLSGRNGEGKTSVLEAIKCVLKGGEDATLLRRGAEKGEVILILDDGTQIGRRITEKTSLPFVEKDGIKLDRPMSAIKALSDMMSVNPIDFLRAPKKQRTDVLLESLPMQVDQAKLEEIVGHSLNGLIPNAHALEQISAVRQIAFDERTGTNRMVREKESTITQLTQTLPTDAEAPPPEDEAGILAEINVIDGRRDDELARINSKLDALRTTRDSAINASRSDTAAQTASLYQQIELLRTQIGEIESAGTAAVTKLNDEFATQNTNANQMIVKARTTHAQERAGLDARLNNIKQIIAAAARHAQTTETIAAMEDELIGLNAEAARLTAAIDAIDAYKVSLLSALPIKGMEVIEGEIFCNGVPFDRLNTQQQVSIAVEIAKLRSGTLGVICVDGIELLDEKHYDEFRSQILASGLQMFVAKVSNDDLAIDVTDQEAA